MEMCVYCGGAGANADDGYGQPAHRSCLDSMERLGRVMQDLVKEGKFIQIKPGLYRKNPEATMPGPEIMRLLPPIGPTFIDEEQPKIPCKLPQQGTDHLKDYTEK